LLIKQWFATTCVKKITKEKIMFKKIAITLAALVAIIPIASINNVPRVLGVGGCTVNGQEVPGDPYLIEGTRKADVIDCRTSPTGHHIYSDAGDDLVYGSEYDDFIEGHGGNDTEYGMGGNDAIDGGSEDDTIYGGAGDDVIFGGVGASPASGVACELETAAAGSKVFAKIAKDIMLDDNGDLAMRVGGSGDDTIYGGDGNDCINSGSGLDFVYGEAGNDTIYGGNHADYLDGGLGIDWIDGGWHEDTCLNGETYVDCEIFP
jgi:Ca2+-binding RTX toxin-like protein